MQQNLYDTDFYAWTQSQAEFIKNKQFDKLDIDNLFDEVESMGKSEHRELTNRLEILLMHLLKWKYQAERRGRSWKYTIEEQRRKIKKMIITMPSLKSKLPEIIIDAYDDAVFGASKETGITITVFPKECPWNIEEITNKEFYPDGE